MKQRYHLFRRENGIYYSLDTLTTKRASLKTTDLETARRLLSAQNEACRQPAINLQIARAYLAASDPKMAERTWQEVMDQIPQFKTGSTRTRWLTAINDQAFNRIRALPLLETRAEHFLAVLEAGSISTNCYLRRIHHFALDMNWLPWPVLPRNRPMPQRSRQYSSKLACVAR